MREAVSASGSARRPRRMRDEAPARAWERDVARPMPLPAPVTKMLDWGGREKEDRKG